MADEAVALRYNAKRRCVDCGDVAQLAGRAPPSTRWSSERDFGIVIDAGSSGSRIQVYSWLRHEQARQQRQRAGRPLDVLPKVEVGVEAGEGWHHKVTPGISSYGAEPAGVDDHLRPLLDHALSVVPRHSVPDTPIYLLATAGMRLVPDAQRDAILQRACRFMREQYAFKVGDCAQTVRVISGEEEGLYGWVAVNYLLDGFDQHLHDDSSGHATSSTFGFLDMGGASTQIAFEPSPAERLAHADNLVDVHLRQLDGRDVAHPVFVTTWLGYGTNQARQRFVDAQIAALVDSPQSAVSDAEAHLQLIDDPCLPRSLVLDEKRHPGIAFRGTGDFAACVRRQSPLLNKDAPCLDEPCLFAGVHAPRIDFSVNHFIGVSEYWYSTQELWSLGGVYDFVSFEKHAARYCSRDWSELRAESVDAVQQDRLELQCFKAAWIVNILHEGIGIPRYKLDPGGSGDGRDHLVAETAELKAGEKGLVKPTSDGKPMFQSLDTVGDVSISWTLGKMVLEVSQSVHPDRDLPHAGSEALDFPAGWRRRYGASRPDPFLVILVVMLLAGLAWFCSSARRRKVFTSWRRRSSARGSTDYALVGMEEGIGRAPSPSPRLNGHASPRLGVDPKGQRRNSPPRPRLMRHAFSTPNVVGKRIPSSKDRHGRVISTDIGYTSNTVTEDSDDEGTTTTSLSRVASQASLHGAGVWMPRTGKELRGRSATPTGGSLYGAEDV